MERTITGPRTGWYSHTVRVTTLFLLVLTVATIPLFEVELGLSEAPGQTILSIVMSYPGVGPEKIEEMITIPLEKELASIPGIDTCRSICEYGKTRTAVHLADGYSYRRLYFTLRDQVQRVYNRLPDAVRKPRIYSTGSHNTPVFIVSVSAPGKSCSEVRSLVEENLKPAFQRVAGTGEIEVGGGSTGEVHVLIDPHKAAALELPITEVAKIIQKNSITVPTGTVSLPTCDIPVLFRGKLQNLDTLAALMIPLPSGKSVKLHTIANVEYGFREQRMISRVNGEKRVTIAVESNGSANLIALCKNLREVTQAWKEGGLHWEVILDRGQSMETVIHHLLFSIAAGIAAVVLFLFITSPKMFSFRDTLLLSFSVPVCLLVTAGVLAACRVSLDRSILAGFAAGIGLVIDTGIILTHTLRSVKGSKTERVRSVAPALGSSAVTTLVAMLPLFFLGPEMEGITHMARALCLLILTGLLLPLMFLPTFFRLPVEAERGMLPSSRILRRLFYKILISVLRRRQGVLAGALLVCAGGVTALCCTGADFSPHHSEPMLFTRLEFESGASPGSVDAGCTRLAALLEPIPGITMIETTARRGSATMVVRYDPEITNGTAVEQALKRAACTLQHCFPYFPGRSRETERTIEITITGSNVERLKQLARTTAQTLSEKKTITEAVLHFKDNPPVYCYSVDHEKTHKAGLSPSWLASTLRWNLHGPVALKWNHEGGERDLRVMGGRQLLHSREQLERLPVTGTDSPLSPKLAGLGSFTTTTGPSRIYRENRQRVVYLSIRSSGSSLQTTVDEIRSGLCEITLPEGYGFIIDRKLAELQDRFRTVTLLFLLSLLLIYMVLAAQFESLVLPLAVLSFLPLPLSLPFLALRVAGAPLTVNVLVGIIILSGIAVNNGILIVADMHNRAASFSAVCRHSVLSYTPKACHETSIIRAVRRRLPPMLLTSGSTLLGSLPLLFLAGRTGSPCDSPAFILVWGMAGSLPATFFFYPALLSLFFSAGKVRSRGGMERLR